MAGVLNTDAAVVMDHAASSVSMAGMMVDAAEVVVQIGAALLGEITSGMVAVGAAVLGGITSGMDRLMVRRSGAVLGLT